MVPSSSRQPQSNQKPKPITHKQTTHHPQTDNPPPPSPTPTSLTPDPAAICSRGWRAKCAILDDSIINVPVFVATHAGKTILGRDGRWHGIGKEPNVHLGSYQDALLALSQAPPPPDCKDDDAVWERYAWNDVRVNDPAPSEPRTPQEASWYSLGYANAKRAKEKSCGTGSNASGAGSSGTTAPASTSAPSVAVMLGWWELNAWIKWDFVVHREGPSDVAPEDRRPLNIPKSEKGATDAK